MLGKRIAVWGPSSSGKTTLAAAIADGLGLTHVEMDAIFWKPDWVETPLDEFRTAIVAVMEANPDGWVMDGNYARVQDLVLPHADTVVCLRLPLWLVMWRVTRRTIGRIISGEPLWGSNKETWGKAFFSRESLLWYVLKNWRRYTRKRREVLAAVPHRAEVIVLRSRKEVARFLAELA